MVGHIEALFVDRVGADRTLIFADTVLLHEPKLAGVVVAGQRKSMPHCDLRVLQSSLPFIRDFVLIDVDICLFREACRRKDCNF